MKRGLQQSINILIIEYILQNYRLMWNFLQSTVLDQIASIYSAYMPSVIRILSYLNIIDFPWSILLIMINGLIIFKIISNKEGFPREVSDTFRIIVVQMIIYKLFFISKETCDCDFKANYTVIMHIILFFSTFNRIFVL